MDKCQIKSLIINASIGVFAWEKQVKQRLSIDLEFTLKNPATVDMTIEDGIDYAQVVASIQELIAAKHYDLIENLAATLADHLMTTFQIPWLSLCVYKSEVIPGVKQIGICVERSVNPTNNPI